MPPQKQHEESLADFLDSHGLTDSLFAETLLETSRSGCALLDQNGAVLYANHLAQKELGILLGSKLVEFAPELVQRVKRLQAGGEDPGGGVLRRAKAAYLARLSVAGCGNAVVGTLCVFIRMTLSEIATREMRVYEELVRYQDDLLNSLSEGLWICDRHENLIYINPGAERINYLKAGEVVGRNLGDLLKEGVFDRSVMLEVFRTKAPVSFLQTRKGRKVALTGIPVIDDGGEIVRVVVSEKEIADLEALRRAFDEQVAISDRVRDHMVEMQLDKVESSQMIAKSPSVQQALGQAIKVAGFDSTVLMLGESGVGKELFANVIYKNSPRAGKPFVKINCGAIPESLIEAELFGYDKGAFTGAQVKGKPGYLELANGGVLFLDEVAELTHSAQVKLLRFLEDGQVTRVGATQSQKLNVRILAATHRNLKEMVEAGAFRLDLFYRLNVIPIHIPPLRERTDCILPLLRHFVDLFDARAGVHHRFSRDAIEALMAYQWPGNVRELANLCERVVVMSQSELIGLADLPGEIAGGKVALRSISPMDLTLGQVVDNTERAVLAEMLQRHHTQAKMAKVLGISQSSVARKLKKYGIL
jgi:TyrR family helix-turn-helix protein